MTNQPTHRAYLVSETDPEGNKKPYWTEVGAVWPHSKGGGFDLVLPEGLAVYGRIGQRPGLARAEPDATPDVPVRRCACSSAR